MKINQYLKRLKKRHFLIRLGLVVGYLVIMVLILPRTFRLDYNYEVGKKWQHKNLRAPFDFAIYKSPEELNAQKLRAAAQIPEIYQIDSLGIQDSRRAISRELSEVLGRLQEMQAAFQAGDSSKYQAQLREIQSLYPSSIDWEEMQRMAGSEVGSQIQQLADQIAVAVYQMGFLDQVRLDTSMRFISLEISKGEEKYIPFDALLTSEEDLETFITIRLSGVSRTLASYLTQVLLRHVQPNYVFHESKTKEARKLQMSMVSPLEGKVKKGDLIIENGQQVTETTGEVIESLIREQKDQFGQENRWLTFVSQFLIVTTLTLVFLVHLSIYRSRIYFDNRKLALVLFTFLLAVSGMVVATKLTDVAARMKV